MASKLNKMDMEKLLNLKPSTDSIFDTSAPKWTRAEPKRQKRLEKVLAKPLPHKQDRVAKSSNPLASTGGIQESAATAIAGNVPSSEVPSVDPAPTIVDDHFCPDMINDGVRSSSEIDNMHFDKLGKVEMFKAAQVHQEHALNLMKNVEQDLISDGLDKLIKDNENDKLIKENEDLKQKMDIAHKAQDKLKKEVFELNNKQKIWRMEKIDLEYALKEDRDLLKSTQVNLSEQKRRLHRVMYQEAHQYLEGFYCAKSQAAFLCSIDERKLDAMRLWGQVRDGEIVVDEEQEESEDSHSRAYDSSKDSKFEVDLK